MADPGLVARLLGRHPEVHHVHQDLGVALGLEVSAHHAEGQHRPVLSRDERRDDRVERPLVGLETVAVPRVE